MYGAWYGLGRFFIEGLRTDSLTFGEIRISQMVAALAFIICTGLLIYLSSKNKKKSQEVPYEAMFKEQMDDEGELSFEENDESIDEVTEEKSKLSEEKENATDN